LWDRHFGDTFKNILQKKRIKNTKDSGRIFTKEFRATEDEAYSYRLQIKYRR